jgi:bisphosphoglycerate-dependent phosphoglycerate mutase
LAILAEVGLAKSMSVRTRNANRDKCFTGWMDVDLCDKGVGQAHRAAALLKAHQIVLYLPSQARHPNLVNRSR